MRALRLSAVLVVLLASGISGSVLAQFRVMPPDFIAQLSGHNENPAVDTTARGTAQFRLINRGDTLFYRITVQNISNVTTAHLHMAAQGINGPAVAFLLNPQPAGGGPVDGLLVEGTIEYNNLFGPLEGQSFSVLIEAMRTGGIYVNVHTDDGQDPVNSGPGDSPGGEIRGQVRRARDHSPRRIQDPE